MYIQNKNDEAMSLILNCLALILTKKVPSECGVSKIESLHNKVRLLSPQFFHKSDTHPENAVVRVLTTPRLPTSPHSQASEDKEAQTAYALNGNTLSLPYSVVVLNQ